MRGCEGDVNARVGERAGVVGMSAGYEYVGCTRGLGIVSNAADECGAWDERSWWSV